MHFQLPSLIPGRHECTFCHQRHAFSGRGSHNTWPLISGLFHLVSSRSIQVVNCVSMSFFSRLNNIPFHPFTGLCVGSILWLLQIVLLHNDDADTEKGIVDTVGEGGGGKNWENSTETTALPCGEWDSQRNFAVRHRELKAEALWWLGGARGGRELPEGRDMCAPVAGSGWCMAEANTIL